MPNLNQGRYRTPSPFISRTSTVLFDDVAHLRVALEGMRTGSPATTTYGTFRTPTTAALEELLLDGEGGAGVALSPSGLAAIAIGLFAMTRAGGHLLVTNSAYGPTRDLCDNLLTQMGVDVEYYDPLLGAAIAGLIRPETTGVWLESPGTHTFEMQDVPAIAAAAARASAARGGDHPVLTGIDNTWASPGFLRPFELGMDISAVALTKYWGGHADLPRARRSPTRPRCRPSERPPGTWACASTARTRSS